MIDGLIIPGGESTTISKLLKDFNIFDALKRRIEDGLPVWGTCAGLILLSKYINGEKSGHLEVMDINVKRNAYGSQINSFSTIYERIDDISNVPIPMVFIRAPYIISVGSDVKVLKLLDGKIVAARQKHMLATAFHPELTDNTAVHEYFISMVKESATCRF